MDRGRFQGVLTALVTPFSGGKVDTEALGKLVDWQIAEGVDGLVAVGTTGESPVLSDDEHVVVVRTVVEAAGGRVPVVGGAGSNSTAHAVHLAKACQRAGADAVLAVTPYYNKPTQAGLEAHFGAIAEATDLPVVLYNVPGRTVTDLLPRAIGRLAALESVVAVKEATGSMARANQVMAACGDRCTFLSGDDFTAFPSFALGGRGVISVVSNVAPSWMVACWDAYARGDWEAARKAHHRMIPLVDLLFSEPNPVPSKHALMRMGRMKSDVRLPLVPMTDEGQRALDAYLSEEGLS